MSPSTIFIITWCLEGSLAVFLNVCGLYFLLTEKKKKVSNLILIHMSFTEILFLSLEVPYHTSVLLIYSEIYSRHIWKKCFTLLLLVTKFQSMILLTLDRILAVKLGLHYASTVTKKRLFVAYIGVWTVTLAHIPYAIFTRKNTIYLVWELLVLVFIILSYAYILIKIHLQRVKMAAIDSTGSHSNSNYPPVKYHVPLLIVLIFLGFFVVPSLALETGIKKPIWFYSIWYVYYMFSPIIYTFGQPKFRGRISRYFTSFLSTSGMHGRAVNGS